MRNHPDWNTAPDVGRRATILRALARLHALSAGPICIVEIGTLRDDAPDHRDSDGWSTLAFGWYCRQVGGVAYTVDIEPSAEISARSASVSPSPNSCRNTLRGLNSIGSGVCASRNDSVVL